MNSKELHSNELPVESCSLLPDSKSVVKWGFFERADCSRVPEMLGQHFQAQGGIVLAG